MLESALLAIIINSKAARLVHGKNEELITANATASPLTISHHPAEIY